MILYKRTGEEIPHKDLDLHNNRDWENYIISPLRKGIVTCNKKGVEKKYVNLTETLGIQKSEDVKKYLQSKYGENYFELWNKMVTDICNVNKEYIIKEFRDKIETVQFDDIGEISMDDLEIRVKPNTAKIKRVFIQVKLKDGVNNRIMNNNVVDRNDMSLKNSLLGTLMSENEFDVETTQISINDYLDDVINHLSTEIFQRRVVWSDKIKKDYIIRLLSNKPKHDDFIIVDIQSLLGKDIRCHQTIQTYSDLRDRGFRYESIDGQNRGNAIKEFVNNDLSVKIGVEEIKFEDFNEQHKWKFLNTYLNVTIYRKGTIESLSNEFKSINSGVPLSDMEYYDSTICEVKFKIDELVDISNHGWWIQKYFTGDINSNKTGEGSYIRKGDKLFLVKVINLINEGIYTKSKLNELYENDKIDYVRNAIPYLDLLKNFFKIRKDVRNSEAKLLEGSLVNLLIELTIMKENNQKIFDYETFYMSSTNSESERRADNGVLYYEEKDNNPVSYTEACKKNAAPRALKERKKKILKDYNQKKLEEMGVCNLDKKRAFPESIVGKKLYQQNIHEDERSNYHADHIIPYSKGGSTTEDNCELILAEDNLKKGNR